MLQNITLGAIPGRNHFNPNTPLCFESKPSAFAHMAISRQIRKASNQKNLLSKIMQSVILGKVPV